MRSLSTRRVVKLDKTFIRCGHCGHAAAQPVYTCPVCDWPRQHSEETPPPTLSCPDPEAPQSQRRDPLAQVVLETAAPAEAAPQAAKLAAIPDLGVINLAPAQGPAIIKLIQLAEEDPIPEEEPE